MPSAIAMPRLGMTMQEGTVVDWPVPLGEHVERGQQVLVIESEKAEVEIEATQSGFLRHVYVEPGETVPCGTLLAALTDTCDEDFDADAFRLEHAGPAADAARQEPAVAVPAPAKAARAPMPRIGRAAVAPAARRRAKELGIDPERVPGSGPGGRVTREDVEAFATHREGLVKVAEGVRLEVPSQGEGDTVLLLPGFGTDVSAFAPQTRVLAERFHVRGVNPRGVGRSDAPENEVYDVATTAEDAAAVIDAPAHVIGTSLGSAAAIELALRHPAKVRSLALLAPLVRASGRLLAVSRMWCTLAATLGPAELADALMPWFFSPGLLADESVRARTQRGLAATLARVPATTLERMAAGMGAWSGTRAAELAGITAPTLVVVAGGDLLVPDGADVAAAIPGARGVTLKSAGHGVGIEAAEEVNTALLEHLTAH